MSAGRRRTWVPSTDEQAAAAAEARRMLEAAGFPPSQVDAYAPFAAASLAHSHKRCPACGVWFERYSRTPSRRAGRAICRQCDNAYTATRRDAGLKA